MARALAPIVLLLTTTAAQAAPGEPAELAIGEAQLELLPRRDYFDPESREPFQRFAGFAQLTGGGEGGGDLAAGAAVAVAGFGCDLVNASAQGRLRPFADALVVGDARYEVCVSRVGLTVIFEGRRGAGLAPAIDARRSLWRRRYDLRFDRITIGGGELGEGRLGHVFGTVAVGYGTTRQADGASERELDQIDIDAAAYGVRYRVPGLEVRLDALVLDADATKEDGGTSGGVTTAFDPLRAAIETGGWFASARAGWGMSGGQASVSSTTEVDGEVVDMWEETIDGEGLPKLTLGVGELEVGARRDRWEARASVERSLFPTFDGNLALEERASGSVAYAFGRRRATRVKLSPFAARTWTWTRDAGSSYEESVGASVHAGHALREQLRIDAIGEAGVTPYARLDGVRDPEARLGGRVLVALSAFVSR